MSEVTIIINCAGRAEMLAASLPCALDQRGADCEVRVIENGHDDAVAEIVAAHPAVSSIRLENRASYAAAYNAALAEPTASTVLLLNDDCFLEPSFCAGALEALEGDGVGAVQGKLLRATGPGPEARLDEIDSAGIVFDRRHRNSIAGHGAPGESHSMPGPVFGPDGAAALYSRRMLDEVALGGEVFDETIGMYATDADLAWRARLQGWRAVYAPQAVAYHVRTYSPSTRQRVTRASRREQFRNRYLMMLKNETAITLLRHLPWVLAFEVLAAGHALLRERFLLRGYLEVLAAIPATLRRRSAARSRRSAGSRELTPFLAGLAPTP